MLAGLPVGQWAPLLWRCGQQAEAPVRGARPSLPRNARSHAPGVPLEQVFITQAAGAAAKVVSPPRIGRSGAPARFLRRSWFGVWQAPHPRLHLPRVKNGLAAEPPRPGELPCGRYIKPRWALTL